jgi:hypothetical protein
VTIRETARSAAPDVTLGTAGDGARAAGPTVLRLDGATVVVPRGWSARTDDHGTLHLEADDPVPAPAPWEADA